MSKKLRELQARKAKQVAALRLVTERADAEARDLTAEEQNDHDAKSAELETTNQAIAREERLLVEEASLGTPSGNAMLSVHDLREDDLRRGFSSFGDFAHAVVRASGAGNRDPRLTFEAAAPSTYGGELSGVDGGFAVPPQFAREIFTLSLGEDSFVPYTDALDIESNSMVLPKDETTPWGTDGIRAYWQAEATAANATKLKLGTLALRMHKLMALVPVSDELLEDTSALTNYLPKKVASSIRWKTNDAIINGTGAGQPLGVVNSGAVVTVSKDAGQAASTLTITNLANMMAQLPPGSWSTAVWMIHNTALGALFSLNSSGFPYYLPFGNGKGALADSPFGSLLGRPVLVTQHANVFSSIGDVQLHDLQYYQTIKKAAGIETATSMHLYFDADATAFRAILRIDGKPKIANPITQAKGTTKLSPFLQLQAR